MARFQPSEFHSPVSPSRITAFSFQVLGALALTALLLLFLGWLRWKENDRVPMHTFRSVEHLAPVQLPARSTAPPAEPPPPKAPELPELSFDAPKTAPPLNARIQPMLKPDFQRLELDFKIPVRTDAPALNLSAPPVKTSYDVNELDAMPMLINRPTVAYPASLARQGILSGMVVMEVSINPQGRVHILTLKECSHPDLERMARRFAERARFTSPQKDGRPVTATYHWPLKLTR
ncbi:energy transducer TonB [Pontiellaceae bacterium B12219]|nr:energy transducer TonB [Pontiellaceae bacterium B12219]